MRPLPLPSPQLADGELVLRPWHADDAPALCDICQDETVLRWTHVPAGYTLEMARARVEQAEAERKAGRQLILAIADADDVAVGGCDLRLALDDRARAEIAYMLGRQARGRGLATRAARLLSRWAIDQLGVTRVEILAHPENDASLAVAARAGFTREGVLRAFRVRAGRREDLVMLSMLAADR